MTNEIEDRPCTKEELDFIELQRAEANLQKEQADAIRMQEESARESARTKLAALGLTEAEVAALVK